MMNPDRAVMEKTRVDGYPVSSGPARKIRGISFVELMVALFFLNVTFLLLIGIIALMVRSSQKLLDQSSGMLVASEVMETYIYNNPKPAAGSTSGEIYSEGMHFEYKLDVVEVYPKLKKVDCKVFWWSSSTEYKEGYGKLFTSISTLSRDEEVTP
jgi:Tfp pilus assembly protein PilV